MSTTGCTDADCTSGTTERSARRHVDRATCSSADACPPATEHTLAPLAIESTQCPAAANENRRSFEPLTAASRLHLPRWNTAQITLAAQRKCISMLHSTCASRCMEETPALEGLPAIARMPKLLRVLQGTPEGNMKLVSCGKSSSI